MDIVNVEMSEKMTFYLSASAASHVCIICECAPYTYFLAHPHGRFA